MKLTENFNLNEFNCNDGSVVPEKYMPNVKELAANLQVLRNYLNEPIHINSSYRTINYNARIGGAKNSQHLTASAADIVIKSKTPYQLAKVIEYLIDNNAMKQGGIGIYKGFIHYDIRGKKARW